MDRETAKERIMYLGFTDEETEQALERADEDFRLTITKKQITVIGKCFTDGRINDDEAKVKLAVLGVAPERWEQWLTLWQADKDCSSKRLTGTELVKSFKVGLITIDDLANGLARLNYSSEAISLTLANAVYDLDAIARKKREKELANELKLRDKLAKELQRQIDRQQRRKKKLDMLNLDLDKALDKAGTIQQIADLQSQAKLDKAQAETEQDKAEIEARLIQDISEVKSEDILEFAEREHDTKGQDPL